MQLIPCIVLFVFIFFVFTYWVWVFDEVRLWSCWELLNVYPAKWKRRIYSNLLTLIFKQILCFILLVEISEIVSRWSVFFNVKIHYLLYYRGILLWTQVYGPNFKSKEHSVRQKSQKRGVFGWSKILHKKGVFRWRKSKQNVFYHKFICKAVKHFDFLNKLVISLSKKKARKKEIWGHWVTNLIKTQKTWCLWVWEQNFKGSLSEVWAEKGGLKSHIAYLMGVPSPGYINCWAIKPYTMLLLDW